MTPIDEIVNGLKKEFPELYLYDDPNDDIVEGWKFVAPKIKTAIEKYGKQEYEQRKMKLLLIMVFTWIMGWGVGYVFGRLRKKSLNEEKQ